jgi:hypothetical protein
VYAPAERADTIPLFLLYPCMYSMYPAGRWGVSGCDISYFAWYSYSHKEAVLREFLKNKFYSLMQIIDFFSSFNVDFEALHKI